MATQITQTKSMDFQAAMPNSANDFNNIKRQFTSATANALLSIVYLRKKNSGGGNEIQNKTIER